MADFAAISNATAAGYALVQIDHGASAPAATRFESLLEKWTDGGPGSSGSMFRANGLGSSQANADAGALTSLNAQRRHKYQGAPARSDTSSLSATGKPAGHSYAGSGTYDSAPAQTLDN